MGMVSSTPKAGRGAAGLGPVLGRGSAGACCGPCPGMRKWSRAFWLPGSEPQAGGGEKEELTDGSHKGRGARVRSASPSAGSALPRQPCPPQAGDSPPVAAAH